MALNIGRVLKPIGTAIRKKIEQAEEDRKFNQEYQQKLKDERRKAELENIPKIAKAEADRRVQLAKKGQSQQNKGAFEKLTGQKFFMSGQQTGRKSSQSSNPFAGMGGGISDADMKLLGMSPAKKHSSEKHKKKKSGGTTIIIKK